MKNITSYLLTAWAFLFVSLPLYSEEQKSPDSNKCNVLAKDFIDLLTKEDYSDAAKYFDSTMNTVVPVGKLQEVWKSLIAQVGSAQKQIGERMEISGQYDVVFVTYKFNRAVLDIKVTFNSAKQIAGLFFLPSQSSSQYKPPLYAKPDSFHEKEVTIGNGEWSLPGTITFPSGSGLFSALVLVHGSGPNDRDETIGPNKVFRDLAWGLASRGIAVLRYEKRTKVHALKIVSLKDSITVKEETIDDALAAVSLLQKTTGIDTAKIFVLGHSLGGMLVPRIGTGIPAIHGFIIMAGPTRPLEDIIHDQMFYILSLDSTSVNEKKIQLEKIGEQVARAKGPTLSLTTPSNDLPLGMSPKYILDLRGYKPSEFAKNLKQPILIIQGERDYQVTLEDFKGWKNSLSSRQNVEFKSYPKLNHLFIEGEGKSTPDEYQKTGHVAECAVDDIADWIKRQ